MNIALLILAAGASTRMGKPKQLLPWKRTTLLGHAIETALSSKADRVILILGAGAEAIRKTVEGRGCDIIVNKAWEEGLGSTIRTGMSFVHSLDPVPDAVVLMLADQPLLDADYLNLLIRHFDRGDGDIVCTAYGKKLGVPAIFHRKYFQALAGLEGDTGAGKLIASHAASAFGLPAGERVADLDTPQDYIALSLTQEKPDP